MPIDPETRAYLDDVWTCSKINMGRGMLIRGSDGDGIALLDYHNAAHLMDAADVAEYLMELHREHVSMLMLRRELEK